MIKQWKDKKIFQDKPGFTLPIFHDPHTQTPRLTLRFCEIDAVAGLKLEDMRDLIKKSNKPIINVNDDCLTKLKKCFEIAADKRGRSEDNNLQTVEGLLGPHVNEYLRAIIHGMKNYMSEKVPQSPKPQDSPSLDEEISPVAEPQNQDPFKMIKELLENFNKKVKEISKQEDIPQEAEMKIINLFGTMLSEYSGMTKILEGAREIRGYLGFMCNMLRSVCNGNSCGEEVFREMSLGGLVKGEEEVLKKKWHVWGGPRYNREEYDGDENSPGKYKNDQVGAVIGINRHLGDEKERGFVVGAFVKVACHNMTQQKKKGYTMQKKCGSHILKGKLSCAKRSKDIINGKTTSGVLGLCGGYANPEFEVMLLVRGSYTNYEVEGLAVKNLCTDFFPYYDEKIKFDGKGFGGELGGMWKIRVSDKIVVGPCLGIEGSIEKYDEDKKKCINEGESNRALAKVGVECRAELGCGNDLRVKLAYKRILNGEIPKITVGRNKEDIKGIKESQDIGEIGLGWNWEIGKVVGVHANLKYTMSKNYRDIYANLGLGYSF
jgi:outer membrane autotransporter protein